MHLRAVTLLGLLAVALMARAGDAQTSRPSKTTAGTSSIAPPAQPAVEKVIRRSNDSAPTTRQSTATKAPTFDTQRVILSLGLVLALILVLRWASQKLFGKQIGGRASRAVQVLSRNPISPKQQLLVVQVGRRLVVVGDSGQQMNTLCEITDPDEMAALIGQLHEEKRDASPNPFGAIFGRAGSAFDKSDAVEPQRSLDVSDEDDGSEPVGLPSDEQVTRDELHGLMDKVRGMSRQFRRS
jgi:flagellar biosynthetic protein FliO